MEIYNVKITLSEVQSRKRAKDGGSALWTGLMHVTLRGVLNEHCFNSLWDFTLLYVF